MQKQAETMARGGQRTLCAALTQLERHADPTVDPEKQWREDLWERPGGGGGTTRVLEDGTVFERAGVNVSVVHGSLEGEATLSAMINAQRDNNDSAGTLPPLTPRTRFFATGVSAVFHPRNPLAPTAHLNYRYFEIEPEAGAGPTTWWFGGGADLTPYYLFEEDAVRFHQAHRDACETIDLDFYPRFKRSCDEYFYLPHRQEARGIGGIFFDHLNDRKPEVLLNLCRVCIDAFAGTYFPIVSERHAMPYSAAERTWQETRRGRYVEFNLIYDRGTAFGLRTQGRTESILMSLPPQVAWTYGQCPQPGTPEADLLKVLSSPAREWV